MTLEPFDDIYQRAAGRKGGEAQLEARLSKPLSVSELKAIPDDRWLSMLSLSVFQTGFSWKVVRSKWPEFEKVFFGFNPQSLLMMPDEMWEQKAKDPNIIRHMNKVMSIQANAHMIVSAKREGGSFAELVADWPAERITELWGYMKEHGKRLGGNTGPYALRQMGKDTFILSGDVESYLRNYKIIEGGRDTKRSLQAANAAFCHWQRESGRSLTEISQIIALSSGDNWV